MSKDESKEFKLVVAGGLSGVAEAITVQPFDMVKTRHQLNSGHNESILRTLKSLYKEGGILRFYRGMTAELFGMVPKSSGMYASYEMARQYLAKQEGFGDSTLSCSIAGFISGIPEALIVNPFQVVKVRLQSKDHLGRYSGSFDCTTKLVKEEGISVFTTGLGPTLWRNCVWNTVYFGLMNAIKGILPSPNSKTEETAISFVSGFFGAVIATCFNAPFDVVKSRFQSQLPDSNGKLKYRGVFQSLRLIYREEGFRACYKGFPPKAVRMGLGGAVAIVAFDFFVAVL